jgi:hypothetical protein
MNERIQKLSLFILVLIVAITDLFRPLNDDIIDFMANAHLADYVGGFPSGIDHIFEYKLMGNRIFFYFLYKLWSPFWNDKPIFEAGINLTILILTFLALYFFTRQLKTSHPLLLPFLLLSFFTIYLSAFGGPEYFIVLLCFIMTGILLTKDPRCLWVLGLLFLALCLIKGISCVLAIPILISAYLIDRETIPRFVLELPKIAISLFVSLITILLLFPHVITDSLGVADIISRINETLPNLSVYFTTNLLLFCILTPITIIGLIHSTLFLLERKDRLFLFTGMFLPILVLIFVEKNYIPYYFILLLFPICILYTLHAREIHFYSAIIFILVFWLVVTSPIGIQTTMERDMHTGQQSSIQYIQDHFNFSHQEILYLDYGAAPYYFNALTYCRYPDVHFIRYAITRTDIASNPLYIEEQNCILSYTGKYIISYDSWLRSNASVNQWLETKIKSEYRGVFSGTWAVYERVK